MKLVILGIVICLLTTSCAELQVKRDLTHAQHAEDYKTAAASGAGFDPSTACTDPQAFKSWATFEFTPGAVIHSLPNETNAAAYCLSIPAGAKAMEVHGGTKGGMTFHEAVAIHPSVLFLDQDHATIVDLQKPNLKAGQGFFRGLGVSAIVPLVGKLAAARYAVIYIHPLSTIGEIDVHTGYETIPVPFGPYGTVRARFFD